MHGKTSALQKFRNYAGVTFNYISQEERTVACGNSMFNIRAQSRDLEEEIPNQLLYFSRLTSCYVTLCFSDVPTSLHHQPEFPEGGAR